MLKKAVCVAILLLAVVGPRVPADVHGQPAMLDPSQMSGIPRPDPQVPSATVTVRLIRGELSNRIVDTAVELVAETAGAAPRSEKTNAEGRATFGELSPGTYTARATVDGQTLTSQPISVQAAPAPGVRVMLVFAKSVADQQKELGTPDGKARVDAESPPGSLRVKLVDEAGKPLASLKVTLLSAARGGDKVDSVGTKDAGADGTVAFSDLRSGSDIGYMVSVERDGSRQQSQPFQLTADHGSLVALTIRAVSSDRGALKLGPGTHIIFEPQDDSVQVVENIQLQNTLEQAIDPGPAGLRIPLAAGALSPQVAPGGPSQLSVDASQDGPPVLLWKGPIPPGETMISAGFVLKHRGTLKFQQQLAVRAETLRVVAIKLPDLKLDGVTDSEDRKWNGRELIVASAMLPSVGGVLELTLTGLPTDFYQLRILAAVLAAAIALAFAYVAIYRRPQEDRVIEQNRQRLMRRREALLDELIGLDSSSPATAAGDAKAGGRGTSRPPRSEATVRAELEDVYRQLDELNG